MNAVPRIKIRLSGPLRVVKVDGTDITPRGKRAKALIALLAMANKLARICWAVMRDGSVYHCVKA